MLNHLLITETYHPRLFDGLRQLPYAWDHLPQPTQTELYAALAKTQVWVLRGAIRVEESILVQAPRLRVIIRPGSGTDHIDHAALERRGIQLYTTPHANAVPVAEYVLSTLTFLCRRLWVAALTQREGHWHRRTFIGDELASLTIGLIGFGHNGSLTARRLAAAGAKVLVYDKYKGGFSGEGIQEAPLERLFAEANALSLHIPLTPETKGWANRAFWEAFQHPIYLINAARGEILSLPDLVWALQAGRVLGAAIDVLPAEPPSILSPADRAAWEILQQHPAVLLTPHIAGLTQQSEYRLSLIHI